MILRAADEQGCRAVDQSEQRCLRAADPVFDQDCAASPAKAPAQHGLGSFDRFICAVSNNYAFASSKAVSLYHAGTSGRLDSRAHRCHVTAGSKTGLRNVVSRAGLTGEFL